MFRVIADSFGSDPDIFISRTERFPSSAASATWYCAQKGSETCIVADGDFAVSDTLFFGVTCRAECSYKLKVWYADLLELGEAERQQLRFAEYSTTLVSMRIPRLVSGLPTSSWEVKLEAEQKHASMDLWLSLDDRFQVVEERPAAFFDDRSIGVKFSSTDYAWCTECTVYAIFNVEEEGRHYVSTIARTENDALSAGLATTIYVSPFR